MIPDWMFSQEAYTPSEDKEAFLSKSTKSVLSVLAKLRFREGKDGKFSAIPSLKLFYTILLIILTACSRNYLFTLIMCAAVTVRLAFFFGSIYSTDFKRDSRCRSSFCIYSSSICLYGKSTDIDEYYIQSVCISNADRYFVSWNYME